MNDNPIQPKYDDMFNSGSIKKAEENGNTNGVSGANSSIGNLRNAEESPSGGYVNNVVGRPSAQLGGPIQFIKKKSPVLAIIITLVGGGIWMGGTSLTAMLPVAVGSNLLQKFNIQETSSTIRTNKLIASKMMEGKTSGSCQYIKIACRFQRPSNRFLKQLKKNGIQAVDSSGKALSKTGVFQLDRPKFYRYTNSEGIVKDVAATDLYSTLVKDGEFRKGFHNASMTRFASLADEVFMKIKMRFGFTVADKLNKRVKADLDTKKGTVKSLESVIEDNIQIDDGIKSAIKNGGNEATDALKEAITEEATAEAKQLDNGVGLITKTVAGLCMLSDGPGLVTKTVRGFQMAQVVKYAAVFLTAFGAIKAGDATAEEVSAVGNALTQTSTNGKSAMDSDGMSYAMTDSPIMQSNSYKKFAPGAAVIAALAAVTVITNSAARKKACAAAGNPVTGATIDAALAVNAGETFGITLGIATLDIAGGWALGKFLDKALPPLIEGALKVVPVGDILNKVLGLFVGDLTKGLGGEDVGNALVSGASHIMGQTGNQGGNMPLSVSQAVAYADTTKQVQLAYAEEDRATMSPLDPSSPNTMMGMMIQKLIPYTSSSYAYSSVANTLATISKVALGSVGTILQPMTAKAADPSAEYTQCDDPDLKGNDVAAGPFCNIIYGVPPKYLDKDPVTVVNELIASKDIDEATGDPTDKLVETKPSLKSWLEMCTDGKTAEANNCKITDETANFALYTIDHRIQKTMDEDLPLSAGNGSSGDATPTDNGKQITIITYGHKDGPVPDHTNGFDADVQNVTDKIINDKHGFDPEVQTPILDGAEAKVWLATMENEWYPKFTGGETISIGCSKGHNRSIAIMVAFTKFLRAKGWTVTIHNRDFEFTVPPEYGDGKVGASSFKTYIASMNSPTSKNTFSVAGVIAS